MGLSDNIKRLRESKGWSQEDLARLLKVTDKAVSTWELGTRTPRMGTIQNIADLFCVNKTDLLEDYSADQLDIIDISKYHKIPIVGRIAAGLPLLAEENIEGYTLTDLNHGHTYFALRVHGDSMNAMGINDGYLLVVRQQCEVENGEVAVVMVGDEDATVKRFYQTDTAVTLMPQSTNPIHRPQVYDPETTPIKVLGKVVKVEFTL